MQEPLISIIVPVYKVEAFLRKCVHSLLCQTYSNIEIILVDDGSPDECPKICDDFARRNNNVKVYHKENGGLSSARNYGVSKANGEYIVFVDSDDYVEPEYVEDLWHLLRDYDADLAITRVKREQEKSKPIMEKKQLFHPYTISGDDLFYAVYIEKKVGWQACGKLYRKSLVQAFPFPDGYYEDFAIMYKLFAECNTAVIGDYYWNYHYVCRNGSILKQKINERHFRIFYLCEELNAYVQNKYPNDTVLPAVIYKHAVVQTLNLVKMDWRTFRLIFYKYKNIFKSNLKLLKKDTRISKRELLVFKLLCSTPLLYKLAISLHKG